MTNQPPAGWYPDQSDANVQRYWDGSAWTDQTRPAAPPPDTEPTAPLPPMSGSPTQSPQTSATPWWKRRWVLVTGGVLVVLFIIGSIAGGNDDTKKVDKKTDPTPAPATITVTATPSAEPPPTQATSPKPKKQKPAKGAHTADSWTMPNQVGQDLQASQDRIQAITGNPFFYTASEDATGQSRFQVWDRDWQVCSQKPAAGTRFNDDTDITFFVVKDTEHCP